MIVDTSAVVAILAGEPESETYRRALASAEAAKISAATLVELYAVVDSRSDPAQWRTVDTLLKALRIVTVPFDAEQAAVARQAYRDFGRGSGHPAKLNLGDCYTYALASTTGEPVLFKGDDFSRTDLVPALRPDRA